jgi:hypothetical protein
MTSFNIGKDGDGLSQSKKKSRNFQYIGSVPCILHKEPDRGPCIAMSAPFFSSLEVNKLRRWSRR